MSSQPKSSVRKVLETLGRGTGGITDEKEAVALLGIHLGQVQGANEFDDLSNLVKIRDEARDAMRSTFNVRTVSQVARSHADVLLDALAPLERLIENREVEERNNPPRVEESTAPEETAPVDLSSPQGIRAAARGGNLAASLQDEESLGKVMEWMESADPTDTEQRKDMVAVLNAIDPSNRAERQKAFEFTFSTKVAKSEERNYVPVLLRSGQPSIDRSTGKPRTREELKEVPLNPEALTAMAEVMAELPAAHMPSNWILLGQDADKNTRGSYNDETDYADLQFSLQDVEDGFTQEYAGNCLPGDPLAKSKAFDVLVRHECGHKAGTRLFDALCKEAEPGKWKEYATTENLLATDLKPQFDDFVNAVQVEGAPAANLILAQLKDMNWDPEGLAGELGIDSGRIPGDHLLLQALTQGMFKRYLCGASPVSVDGRMYVVGGPDNHWFSFDKSAWDKRVSLYQYAAPAEWFAEFYATANNGDPGLRAEAKRRFPSAWNTLKQNDCIVFADGL